MRPWETGELYADEIQAMFDYLESEQRQMKAASG